ncbi:acyl-CoA dehydrogenase family protein [Salinibacterium sp. ZJ454]|uniref:acyl-CoA dehydrogenase family protein n=1 Tax=Salinibacterium sp. ZJ454 TaxID=2708339 RepID=UPI0014215687|nr:acyl-CoA dehydrogenase family protein [Salinibacterium sp. ZJ454]
MTITAFETQVQVQASHDETAKKWVDIARSLQHVVEEDLVQALKDTVTTPRVVQLWKDAGLYRAQLPVELGGEGIDYVTEILIMEEISRQDTSAGWVYGVSASGTMLSGSLIPREGFLDILGADFNGLACGFANGKPPGTARKVDGGYVLKSEPMPFGSATQHVDRVCCLAVLVDDDDQPIPGDDGQPIVRLMYPSVEHVEWLNNWDASGLASTGSGHYFVKEHVIEDRFVVTDDPSRLYSHPAFRQGFMGPGYMSHVGAALGLAKRFIEEVAKLTVNKRRGLVPVLDEYPLFQYEFVRIEAEYQAARSFALKAYDDAWAAAERGTFTDLHVTRIIQAATHLHRVLETIASTARLWAGSAVIPPDGVLAKLHADAAVLMNHLLIDPQHYPEHAPALLAVWRDDAQPKTF